MCFFFLSLLFMLFCVLFLFRFVVVVLDIDEFTHRLAVVLQKVKASSITNKFTNE